MTAVIIKGTRDANSALTTVAADMNGAWFLYGQDSPIAAPPVTIFMAKWTYFNGGVYSLQSFVSQEGELHIDAEVYALTGTTSPAVRSNINIERGWHLLKARYSNGLQGGVAGIAWSFYKDGSLTPELTSNPDILGADSGYPDAGSEPTSAPDTRLSLPVFLARPNWSEGITETWAWLTTVNTSESGAEQRRKIRRFPRRYVEGAFRAFNNSRNILDIAIAALGKNECLIPLWFDVIVVRDELQQDTFEIIGDFQYRNYVEGGMLLLKGEGTFDFEVCPIRTITGDKITLNRPLQRTWKNVRMYPVRVAVIDDAVSNANHTSRASDYQVRFRLTQPETKINAAWSYDGGAFPVNGITNLPVINISPNWRDTRDSTFDRIIFQTDNETGVPFVMDAGNQETQDWALPMMLRGLRQHHSFLEMIHAMAGQQMPFHAPTWMQDLILVRDVRGADGALIVERNGYSYYGGIGQDIRRWIYVKTRDSEFINRIVGSRIEGGEEWLFLDQTIGDIPKDEILVLCFLPYSRMSTDTVEITHHTDLTGVSETTLAFRGFIERRNGTPAVF